MKKMPYTIIFLILLVCLVFAGCMHFSKELPGATTARDDGTLPSEEAGTAMGEEDAEAIISEMISGLAEEKDSNGATVYSPEDLTALEQQFRAEASAAASDTQPAVSQGASTTAPSNGQTAQPSQPATTQASTPATTQPTTPAQSSRNEYDILRSGTFYCVGSMKDAEGTNPLEIAIGPNTVYMLTKMDSVSMAVLVSNKKTYMIYPEGKVYLEMSDLILKMMDLDPDELLDSGNFGFSDMKPLSEANAVTDGTLNGQACKIYNFSNEDGTRTLIYMNGNRLLGMEVYSASDTLTSGTYFESVSATIPEDKMSPPAGYTKTTFTKFMTMLAGVL